MIISKDITVGQAALLGTLMRYLPSEYYVENGKLNKVREEGGRTRSDLMNLLGQRLGIEAKEDEVEETVVIDSCELPDNPTALWRVMRLADRTVGHLKAPIVREARGIMHCEDVAISKDGLWIFGNIVGTWEAGKSYLDKYEKDSVAAALVGRNELFCVQVWRMLEREIIVQADLEDSYPVIMINPALIEWLREWVPGGYSMLKTALTNPDSQVRFNKIEEIVRLAPGHAFDDSGEFKPDEMINHIASLTAAVNYAPFSIDEDDFVDFTAGMANTDVAIISKCDCGKCQDEVVSTFGYRGPVSLVVELGAFSSMPKSMNRFNASHDRLRNFLGQYRYTPYDVVADGITDETIVGWTELHLSASAQCTTVQ